jgi:hypothetical protein
MVKVTLTIKQAMRLSSIVGSCIIHVGYLLGFIPLDLLSKEPEVR